jgi:hypothetical protein
MLRHTHPLFIYINYEIFNFFSKYRLQMIEKRAFYNHLKHVF